MVIAPAVLEVIACPQCQGVLKYATKEDVLVCPICRLCFKSIDGGVDLRLGKAAVIKQSGKIVSVALESVVLQPVKGPAMKEANGGTREGILLSKGTCVIVVRQMEVVDRDTEAKGLMVNLDEHLDESSKKILANVMGVRQKMAERPGLGVGTCFGFRRLPDIVVLDASISKVHCIFFYSDAGLGLCDLLSSNGTHVNGKEVEYCHLSNADIVQFGNSAIKVVFPGNEGSR